VSQGRVRLSQTESAKDSGHYRPIHLASRSCASLRGGRGRSLASRQFDRVKDTGSASVARPRCHLPVPCRRFRRASATSTPSEMSQSGWRRQTRQARIPLPFLRHLVAVAFYIFRLLRRLAFSIEPLWVPAATKPHPLDGKRPDRGLAAVRAGPPKRILPAKALSMGANCYTANRARTVLEIEACECAVKIFVIGGVTAPRYGRGLCKTG
jgi:hypothetical protein